MSHFPHRPRRNVSRLAAAALASAAVLAAVPSLAAAQTDYYNTDAGRPIEIEDAYALERYGFEVQAAPLRLERARGGVYNWGLEPELAYGILPRTQLEVGVPLAYVDRGLGGRSTGVAGVDVSVLYNLNVETTIPALALRGDVLIPAGGLGPDKAYPSVTGIVTRTIPGLGATRVHGNVQYTFGDRLEAAQDGGAALAPDALGGGVVELSQWLAGVAVDRVFPLRSALLTGEVYARQPLRQGEDVEWNAGAGVRYQVSPRWALDGGVGRRLTGDDKAWYATFGTAVAFGIPALFPVGR